MSVVCAACKTENRASAMFCRGCAGKLPGFAATGPAALDIVRSLHLPPPPAGDAAREEAAAEGLLQVGSRAFWLRLGLLALGITVGFVTWYVYATRRASPPALPAVAAPAAAKIAPTPPVAVVAPAPQVPAEAPVQAAEALSPGETLAPATAGAATPAPMPAETLAPRNATNPRQPVARRREVDPAGSEPVRTAVADPRPGCAHLNFIAAARCEASQCARAEYRIHPHCDAVREQTRRDIARRDLSN